MGDLIGALAGYIGGKDARVTGQIAALPVYKGKLEKPPEKKPKGELTEKQKQLNAYLAKYQSGDERRGAKRRRGKRRSARCAGEKSRGVDLRLSMRIRAWEASHLRRPKALSGDGHAPRPCVFRNRCVSMT